MKMSIPFLDLETPHLELEAELIEVLRSALRSAEFIGGEAVEQFEEHFRSYSGAAECVGVASGTDALLFALIAGGIPSGTTVLTVANTFMATAEAITQAGALPEFIDIDERTYTMDPGKLRAYLESCPVDPATGGRLSRRTGTPVRAVIPVHLYGQMADMDPILETAREFRLEVIEDACQAHGARYFSKREDRWLTAGSIGKAAAFSFYPGKNLGACGEAGALTTSDPEIARKTRSLRDHGQSRKYFHEMVGYNGRLDSIQAAILDVKLKHLPQWTELRQAAATRYNSMFAGMEEIVTPFESANSQGVYHLYVVRVEDRDRVREALADAQIGTGIHYPMPLHLQKAYASLGYTENSLPITEAAAQQVLSLPMYPQLTAASQQRVVEVMEDILRQTGGKTLAAASR